MKEHGKTQLIPNPHFVNHRFLLQVWNNLEGSEDLAYRLANAGYSVVLAPATNLYFDMAYNKDAAEPGHNWAAYTELANVYDFNPLNFVKQDKFSNKEKLTDFGRTKITGLEATLFSETMRTSDRIDYMLMPRMLGLAERAWASAPVWSSEADAGKSAQLHSDNWSIFVNQVGKRVLPMLDADMPALLYRIPPPGLALKDGMVFVNQQLPGFTLRYTTNGSTPDSNSLEVAGPIEELGTITVTAFSRNGRAGRASVIENH
jgi:hexosaminidase